MKTKLIAALATSSLLLLGGCATRRSNDPAAPSGPPAATVKMDILQASYLGSAATGSGTLHYRGKNYPLTIVAVGGGGIGAQSIHATGTVYRLNSLTAFPGTYTGARSGLTLIKGEMHQRLENSKGTVIYLKGTTSGLSTSMGIDGFAIELK